jgi:hypothetical protein
MQHAAQQTTGEVRPEGRPKKLGKLPSLSQQERAKEHNISPRTQRKLDKLARLRPDLLAQVRAGELSVNRACIVAGYGKALPLFPPRAGSAELS